jgi:hypothetical protein
MLRSISRDDVIIYDKPLDKDGRAAGYNLGDLLNMPSLYDHWGQNPHATSCALERMNLLGTNYEKSVLWYYCANRKEDDIVPDINLIKDSVLKFTTDNIHCFSDIVDIVKDPKCICVHVRNGDSDTELEFINHIEKISHSFDKVVLLSGIHLDTVFKQDEEKIANFLTTINNILKLNSNIYIYLGKADVHLSIMMHASNLLLHKSGFSCLGSIVSTGNLYITEYFGYIDKSRWLAQVNKPYKILKND